MSKTIKLEDNNYLDSSSVIHNREKLSVYLPYQSLTSPLYTTHYMQLGYFNCSLLKYDKQSTLTLLIANTFYDVQHWCTYLLTIVQAESVKANHLKIGGKSRNFYYKIDSENKRVYLYVEVYGGNGFGNWSITMLNKIDCDWVPEIEHNVSKEDSWVEISAVS